MNEQSNGEGWLLFAGILLMVAGFMRFFDAIWAWSYSGAVPSNLQSTRCSGTALRRMVGSGCSSPSSCSCRASRSWCDRSLPGGSASLPPQSDPLVRSGGCPITRSGRSPTSSWASWSYTGWRLMAKGNQPGNQANVMVSDKA